MGRDSVINPTSLGHATKTFEEAADIIGIDILTTLCKTLVIVEKDKVGRGREIVTYGVNSLFAVE